MSQLKESSPLNFVAAFHRTFKHPIEPKPIIPSEKRCQLRISLLAEELKELETAITNKDLVEVADALCDLQYVLAGAILEFGMGGVFNELFEEVQRSNMSKACNSLEEANKTIAFYKAKDNTDAFCETCDGKYLVYRKSDNKTLKNINYSPVNFEKILF